MAQDSSSEHRDAAANLGLVLVVEDDVRTLRLERFVLEEEGFSTLEANSGEEALDKLKQVTPRLILLDIGLPGMDGFATCQRIRETYQIPIIMVTAEERDEDKVRGLESGADDYVTKPFAVAELAARVKAVLRRYEMTSEPKVPSSVASPKPKPDSPEPLQDPDGPTTTPVDDEPEVDLDIYEGTVKLEVQTTGSIRGRIQFVDALRQSEDFHLLRLVADQNKEGMDIWLRLRGPVQLKPTLLQIDGVSDVEIPANGNSEDSEPLLVILLDR
jgi:DNA-binding response OmpR family regulator